MEPFDWKASEIKPTLYALGGIALVLALAFSAGYWQGQRQVAEAVSQSVVQANLHHEAGVINAAQGAIHDQQAEAQTPKIQANDAATKADALEVARLRAEVARLRHPAPGPDPAPSERQDAPQPVPPPLVLAPLDVAKDELIDALTKENGDLKTAVVDLKVALAERSAASESWKASARESQQESLNLRAAIAAKDGLIAGALWKGRIQGFAVGAGSGYVGGKLR